MKIDKFNFKDGVDRIDAAPPYPWSVKPNENRYNPTIQNNPQPKTRTEGDGYQKNVKGRDWSSPSKYSGTFSRTPNIRAIDNNNMTNKLLGMNDKRFNNNDDIVRRKR